MVQYALKLWLLEKSCFIDKTAQHKNLQLSCFVLFPHQMVIKSIQNCQEKQITIAFFSSGCLTNLSEEGLLRLPHHHRSTLCCKLQAGHEGPRSQRQTIPPPVVARLVDGDERSTVQDHPASGGGKGEGEGERGGGQKLKTRRWGLWRRRKTRRSVTHDQDQKPSQTKPSWNKLAGPDLFASPLLQFQCLIDHMKHSNLIKSCVSFFFSFLQPVKRAAHLKAWLRVW